MSSSLPLPSAFVSLLLLANTDLFTHHDHAPTDGNGFVELPNLFGTTPATFCIQSRVCQIVASITANSLSSLFEVEDCLFAEFSFEFVFEDVPDLVLQLLQRVETFTAQLPLQYAKHRVVAGADIRRIRRVLQRVDADLL